MTTRSLIIAVGIAATVGGAASPGARAQERIPRDLLLGHEVRVWLASGLQVSGELLGVTADSLHLLGPLGISSVGLDRVAETSIARHRLSAKKTVAWISVGALASGAGLTSACSSVADDCGGVFVTTFAMWAIVGGLFAAIIGQQRWEDVIPEPEALRPYARYPQGVPAWYRGR